MTRPNPAVAVIDIGSNSIKALVARRAADGTVETLLSRAIDARISAGITQVPPRLSSEGMRNGLAAIKDLLVMIAPHQPFTTVLLATSAVRDAVNGDDFQAQVRQATGHDLRILTGTEEANLIGRGLLCDPSLPDAHDFYVFDLGGGSLECLSFRNRRIDQAVSLQLGCVRLTERFITDRTAAVPPQTLAQIQRHTAATLADSNFQFSLPVGSLAIGTGGTMTTARAVLAKRAGISLEQQSPIIKAAELQQMAVDLGRLALPDRQHIPGLSAPRADVFPTALATLSAIANAGDIEAFHHSLYNLRYGLADELLSTKG